MLTGSFQTLSRQEQFDRILRAQKGDVEAARWVLAEVPRELLTSEAVTQLEALAGSSRPLPLARRIEVGVCIFAGIGLWYLLKETDFLNEDYRKRWSPRFADFNQWLWWLSLAAWSFAPYVLAPISTPGRTQQQRAILVSLIVASATGWWVWVGRDEQMSSYGYSISGIGLLLLTALLSAATIVRLGWGPIPLPRLLRQKGDQRPAP